MTGQENLAMVAIIIVNWNGKEFLKKCFGSLDLQTRKDFKVIFVDNGSNDGSVAFVRKFYPSTEIISLKMNTGFAKANNIGIKKAFESDAIKYIVTLNNDVEVDSSFLSELIKSAQKNTEAAAIVPKMKFFFEKEKINSIGIGIHLDGGGFDRGIGEIDKGQYDKHEEVFGGCAGALLYRREALESVKYQNEFFDEVFFAFYEDLDLSWRLRLAGWKTITCPKAVMYHVHTATGKKNPAFKSFLMNRNRFFVIVKNFPFIFIIKAFFYTLLHYLTLFKGLRSKKGLSYELKQKTNIFAPFLIVFRGWIDNLRYLPIMIKKRQRIQKNKKVSNAIINKWFDDFSLDSKNN